uniref:Uncharacterized protein n=1 Tax=Arundo donax TaxID=35708 RepID=A0A0A8ZGR6_ARUDO
MWRLTIFECSYTLEFSAKNYSWSLHDVGTWVSKSHSFCN